MKPVEVKSTMVHCLKEGDGPKKAWRGKKSSSQDFKF